MKKDLSAKYIFCNVEQLEEEDKDACGHSKNIIGLTEWIKFNPYVNPHFAKHLDIDYYFNESIKYRLNVYEADPDHLNDLSHDHNTLITYSDFVLNDFVNNVKKKDHHKIKLSDKNGFAVIHAEEHKIIEN